MQPAWNVLTGMVTFFQRLLVERLHGKIGSSWAAQQDSWFDSWDWIVTVIFIIVSNNVLHNTIQYKPLWLVPHVCLYEVSYIYNLKSYLITTIALYSACLLILLDLLTSFFGSCWKCLIFFWLMLMVKVLHGWEISHLSSDPSPFAMMAERAFSKRYDKW